MKKETSLCQKKGEMKYSLRNEKEKEMCGGFKRRGINGSLDLPQMFGEKFPQTPKDSKAVAKVPLSPKCQ